MELETTKRIPILLERLLKQYLPPDSIQNFKMYFIRLLSIRLSNPIISENDLKEDILSRLSPSAAEKFQSLYLKLIKLKALSKRTHILYTLSKIRETSSQLIIEKIQQPEAPLYPNINEYFLIPKQSNKLIIMQDELIKDILLMLNNESCKYLSFEQPTEEEFHIKNAETLAPYMHIAEKIWELAWLYKKLKLFIDSEHVSQTNKLLVKYFKKEIEEYNKLLKGINKEPGITLRKLEVWCENPLEKMKWLVILADSAINLKGSQVISIVYSLSRTGNTALSNLMILILEEISESLVEMIELWVNKGEIEDPFQEFFIKDDVLVTENDLWKKKYTLIHELVPSFFPQDLINKILLIGKSINFVTICCKEEWIFEPLKLPPIHDLDNLKICIEKISKTSNDFLLQLINIKYSLDLHFLVIKKTLLLAQGDFHQYLMENLYITLCNNSNSIYKHDLAFILESAIRGSTLKFQSTECLSRIDVKILEPSPLDTGWDVFVLDYLVTAPLTTIFTSKSMETYKRAFKFLWQIKRAQYLLSLYQEGRTMIIYQSYFELKQVMHNFQLFRYEISHFINNLMSYVIVEVVEASWEEFNRKFLEAHDLDELIYLHQLFLDKIIEKAFLNDEGMYKRIMGLIDICVRFYELQKELFDAAAQERNRREVYITVGTIEELMVFDEFLCDVNLIKEQFYDEFASFRSKLVEPNLMHLKFLDFRLDFNEYYEIKLLES